MRRTGMGCMAVTSVAMGRDITPRSCRHDLPAVRCAGGGGTHFAIIVWNIAVVCSMNARRSLHARGLSRMSRSTRKPMKVAASTRAGRRVVAAKPGTDRAEKPILDRDGSPDRRRPETSQAPWKKTADWPRSRLPSAGNSGPRSALQSVSRDIPSCCPLRPTLDLRLASRARCSNVQGP